MTDMELREKDGGPLVVRVAKVFATNRLSPKHTDEECAAHAISLIRAEVLEEAAKVADDARINASGLVEQSTARYIASAIRALKEVKP